jgi:hypothetical protein
MKNIRANYRKIAIEPVVSFHDPMAGSASFLAPGGTSPLNFGRYAQQDFLVSRFPGLGGPIALLCTGLAIAYGQQVSTSPHYTVQRWDAGATESG